MPRNRLTFRPGTKITVHTEGDGTVIVTANEPPPAKNSLESQPQQAHNESGTHSVSSPANQD